jgi:hypothetical protein
MISVLFFHCFRVAREFSSGDVFKLITAESSENYQGIVSARPSAAQEFDVSILLLNFVNSV